MLKWYADNTALSTEKGKPNVFVFGEVVVNENSEKKIEKLLREIKGRYTYSTLPVKWNFKDLKSIYEEFGRLKEYEALLTNSYKWRDELFTKSLEIDYKVILACTERYSSNKPLSKKKNQFNEFIFDANKVEEKYYYIR